MRKSALMVLSHLMLNNMVKVKGQAAEVALRLEDDDARVRDLAMLLFTELAKRGACARMLVRLGCVAWCSLV